MDDTTAKQYPAITKILSETASLETIESLERWKQSLGPGEAEKIRQESKERGIMYDEFIEAHYQGQEIPHAPLSKMLNMYGLHSREQDVHSHTYMYRGRYDIIFEKNGMLVLNDFKGSEKPKRKEWLNDYPLQIAAYAKAAIEMGIPVDYGMITMILDNDVQRFVFSMKELDSHFNHFLLRRQEYKNKYGI